MALFSVNQNVQWFTPTSAEVTELKKVANTSTLLKTDAGKVWFTATSGAKQHRSEVMEIKNGGYLKFVAKADMDTTAKCVKLVMNSGVNSGTPIDNEVYGIYINQRNYHALGDNMFAELGAEVRYGSNFNLGNGYEVINSAAKLLNALALGLVRNLGADNDLYRVIVATASDAATYEVSANTDLHSTSTAAIYIMAKEQDWIQGTMQRERVSVSTEDFFLSDITVNTMDRNDWGTLTDIDLTDTSTYSTLLASLASASIAYSWNNSKDMADMEWFYLGEHGDNMRLAGYPNANAATIKGTIYNINPASSAGYDLIMIHHAYVGAGNAVQKSEQDIMIAVATNSTDGRTIAEKIATALGIDYSGDTNIISKKVYNF